MKRSCYCGKVDESFIGKEIVVSGWVHSRRDHGGVIFIDLRDRSGIVQLAFDENTDKEIFDKVDYYKDVVEFEKSLKNKCYIGILSNLNIYDKDRIDKQLGLKDYDYVFLSFEYEKFCIYSYN